MTGKTTKHYAYALFDLDGTLTDPKEGITKSLQYALRHLGIDVPDREDLASCIGPPLSETFRERFSFNVSQTERAISLYREYFQKQGIFENKLYKGVPELLHSLKVKGYIVALATSKPAVFAEKILQYFGLYEYFDCVGGSLLDGSRSSKDAVIQFVLDELSVEDKKTVLMVGDRKHDIFGATACGIDSAAVFFGYGSKDELEAAGADYFFPTVQDMADFF